MVKFVICILAVFCVTASTGYRLRKRQAAPPQAVIGQQPPPPPLSQEQQPPPGQVPQQPPPQAQRSPPTQASQPAPPLAPELPPAQASQPLSPTPGASQAPPGQESKPPPPQAPQPPQPPPQAPPPSSPQAPKLQQQLFQPLGLPQQQNVPLQNPLLLQQPDFGSQLLLLQQQQQEQPILVPRRNFAPGFEQRPISSDASLNQPRVDLIGDGGHQGDPASSQQQNLAAIRPPDQQEPSGKEERRIQPFPPPPQPPQQQQQQQQLLNGQEELRLRIQQALNQQANAGRDREALLAKLNVTGDQAAAREFVRQVKNLTETLEKQPAAGATVELMKELVNTEMQLAVNNWIMNEELAGQLAATFSIPRESVGTAFVLTPADVDEIKIAGNNPTAGKKFLVELKELLYQKIEHQYRITTDLLSVLSDSVLNLLVGNGVVKEKFADDLATFFYRANNRKIRLF